MSNLKKMTDWGKLQQMLDDQDAKAKGGSKIDEQAFAAHLKTRVKGQDEIVEDAARLIRLQMAMKKHQRPLCNLLFLGPTGTGKTELAKAITEFLFGDESAMLRFDCSEFSSQHSKDRLIGMPVGYVGSDMGGQLTRPMFSNPKRVILFDEIEKAYSGVFDLFLQMMGDGRLTEQGSGKTADFSEAIIILTSNAQSEAIGKIQKEHTDYHEMLNAVKGHLADTKVFRPELLGRIDKVYVFDQLSGTIIAEIALLKISKLAAGFGLQVDFVAPELVMKSLAANQKISRFGIRELERIVFDMYASHFVAARDSGHKTVELGVDERGALQLRPR